MSFLLRKRASYFGNPVPADAGPHLQVWLRGIRNEARGWLHRFSRILKEK